MQRLLVTGKNGQVGSALLRLAGRGYDVIGVDIDDVDLTDLDAVDALVREVRPDWLINPAAYTAVDAAEKDQKTAQVLNADAPAVMAKACAELGIPMLHYSTDYVFDGNGNRPYLEDDAPNPQSVYGATKLAGEQAVRAAQSNSIILRTAWVYAQEGKNFVNTMLRLADEHDSLNVVNDQFGSPTLAEDLAAASLQIIEKTPVDQVGQVSGVYHATGSGETNWADFARAIFRLSDKSAAVNGIPSEQYPTPAPRPNYSVLNNQKLQETFGVALPSWQDALQRTLQN